MKERAVRREQLIASWKRQQAMLAKEEVFITRFGAQASHAAQVQSRVKAIEKIERIVIPPDPKEIGSGSCRLPAAAILWCAWQPVKDLAPPGGRKAPVFHGLTGVVKRQDKIAVTGQRRGKVHASEDNHRQAEASGGECTIGAGVKTGYFSQYSTDLLEPGRTVFEEVADAFPGQARCA